MAERGEPLLMVHAIDRIPDREITDDDMEKVSDLIDERALDDDDKTRLLNMLGLVDGEACDK